ncbi:flagellar motor switch protein FliN/FliY [Clostridium pascui]|uniref:flagellar motor switch phosphatase FliY n=1 Tax=Clostridium pascui TaxID=46609 RepID=UPI00195D6825|nr:flagellar motor switch phosphatase FliY [Clostridium pascui]MBM7869466.1 flagellar motor switch protein FliN/FliY [Clostridium pascui]
MSNDFLSQEEINALLSGELSDFVDESNSTEQSSNDDVDNVFTDIEKDILGEIGNISMGSASTALSQILNQKVNITTPVVSVTTLEKLKADFKVPNLALEVQYTSGIIGENLLLMQVTDAYVIANLMMGGNGEVEQSDGELSELELSAVSEAMNQMIGSAATSMATMFGREVNISPPQSKVWIDLTQPLSDNIAESEAIVKISFKLTIGNLVDSSIMQLLPINTARKIVSIMLGQEESIQENKKEEQHYYKEVETSSSQGKTNDSNYNTYQENLYTGPSNSEAAMMSYEKPVEVHQATFQPLQQQGKHGTALPKNIDLIMDVPLEVSVVLGRTKMNIRDILNLATGSLVELDKLAEEPVEVLVNGKRVAYGEVVVIDENFGVRITSIVSNEEKIRSLGK